MLNHHMQNLYSNWYNSAKKTSNCVSTKSSVFEKQSQLNMSLVTWDSEFVKTVVLAASGGFTEAIVGHPLDSSMVSSSYGDF